MGTSILIVDDDPLTCEAIATCLESWLAGSLTAYADSAGTALEKLRAGHFDLVITDIVMPGMNGCVFATAVRLEFPHIPVIVMSGLGRRAFDNRDDPDFFLCKPFERAQLLDMVERALVSRGCRQNVELMEHGPC